MFALDVAPDQSTATIAVAWKRPDGAVQVDIAGHGEGVEWVVTGLPNCPTLAHES